MSGEEHRRLAAVHSVSPEVYENYLKGKFALAKGNNKSNVEESIAFQRGDPQRPDIRPRYLGLATAYLSLTTFFMGGVAEQERPRAELQRAKRWSLIQNRRRLTC